MLVKYGFNQTNIALISVEKIINISTEIGHLYVQHYILLD